MRWFYYLIFFIIAGVPFSARADIFLPVAEIRCIPELYYLDIRQFAVSGKEAVASFHEHEDAIREQYRIISLLKEFDDHPYETLCRQPDGNYRITVTAAYVYDRTHLLKGRRAAVVNVWLDEMQLIKDLVMEDEREDIRRIKNIVFKTNDDYFFLEGSTHNYKHLSEPAEFFSQTIFYRGPFNNLADEQGNIHPFEFPTRWQREKKESQERINKK